MTREEQIKLASEDYTERNHKDGLFNDIVEGAFIQGAQWTDQHPINPWHDASKELPKVDEKHKHTLVVVARPDNRVHFACYSNEGFFVNESFYGEFQINDVKYWMPIPELPKEE